MVRGTISRLNTRSNACAALAGEDLDAVASAGKAFPECRSLPSDLRRAAVVGHSRARFLPHFDRFIRQEFETLCLMKNLTEADCEQFRFDQIAEGFASALVTAQLIDEQMDESPTAPLHAVCVLATSAAAPAGLAIDRARLSGDSND